MNKWLINKVKYNHWLYNIYYYIGTACLWLLKWLVKPDDKLILFSSFGGRKFDDSPRAIYEAMLRDARFKGYKLVWAFLEPRQHSIPIGEIIATDGLQYYVTALKARLWITNSSIERGLSFKGRNTLYFDTWHGTPIKNMGCDVAAGTKAFGSNGDWPVDVMTAQGEFEADIFSRVFEIPRDKFRVIGLPRNDRLANYTDDYRQSLRQKLGLPQDKKVILYAPTYREYDQSSVGTQLTLPVDFAKWQSRLGATFVLLFRAHYEVAKMMEINDNDFIRNVSNYPSLEDLMIASDLLISDYSSILFDYAIMEKPMVCFTYDYDTYAAKRGMYFDVREQLPAVSTEDELLSLLMSLDEQDVVAHTTAFRSRYVTAYGNAARQSLDIIAKELNI